jgi:hypothetical protein
MIDDFEKIVKEIDEMLQNREIDRLIKKHDEKTIKNKEKETSKKPDDLNYSVTIKQDNPKEEIFELPVKKIIRTIEISC